MQAASRAPWRLLGVWLPVCALALGGCSSIDALQERFGTTRTVIGAQARQPGFIYLPVVTENMTATLARGYVDAGAGGDVQVWYGQPALMLRTRGGVVETADGFPVESFAMTGHGCPDMTRLPLAARTRCERVLDLPGLRGQRESVRFSRPHALAEGWDGLPGPVLLVQESRDPASLPGNQYLYSPDGRLLRSWQWLSPHYWLQIDHADDPASDKAP